METDDRSILRNKGGSSSMKQRRVLGEVHLEVELPSGGLVAQQQRSSTSSLKRLSEVLSDQRCLREQYNSATQLVAKGDQRIEELKKTLNVRNGMVENLENEKGKLLGELKQLSLEKEQLNTQLQEELDIRKMIQVESQKLIHDIKSSYEHKISKLRDEIKTKEEVVSIKEELIKDLEKLVKKLRTEIVTLNGELQTSRTQVRQSQGKITENFRGSISMLESRLSMKSSEAESQIKSLQSRHSEEIARKTKKFESFSDRLQSSLEEKEKELKEVLGRLKESRKSRDATLLDMNEAQAKHDVLVSELKEELKKVLAENAVLKLERVSELDSQIKLEELEVELQQAIKDNDELRDKLEDLLQDREDKEKNIKRLEKSVNRLEGNIEELEIQKQQLYEKTQEYLHQKDAKEESSVAIKLLQEQLEQSQLKLDEAKENLISERHRFQKFNEQFAEMEKNFGLTKVDLRIMTRDKNMADQRVSRNLSRIEKLEKDLEDVTSSRAELEKKVLEMTQLVSESRTNLEKESFQLEQARRMLAETQEEKTRLQAALDNSEKEMGRIKVELSSLNKLKKQLQDCDSLLKKKDEEIQEKTRKNEIIRENVTLLRGASAALENQLREFEVAFTGKVQELESSEIEKTKLSTECSLLKENLQKAKIDLNEANSLKAFLERRLKEVESTMGRTEELSSSTISSMSAKIEELSSKNAELVASSNKFAAEVLNITAEKAYLSTRMDEVSQDNYKLTQELHKCLDTVFELKHETIKLNQEIEDTESKAEARITDLRRLQTTAIQAKDASNIMMQSTIAQQLKVIQLLQDQNEALSNKKKKFHFFSRGEKEAATYQTPVKKTGKTLPRMAQPPSTGSTLTPRPFGINARQQSALVLGKCDEQKLLAELDALNKPKSLPAIPGDSAPKEVPVVASLECHVKKCLLLQDTKQRIDINCSFHILDDLYMMGCEQGLFSRKGETSDVHVVKIDGIGAVYQMEFISSLNSVLFIEGDEQRLFMSSMGIVSACGEAAECSQPKISGSVVAEVQNCHMFEVRDVNQNDLTLCVTTSKHIHILSWKDSIFVLRQKISTPEVVTCMLLTPNSVIYGAGKLYELDTKNFQLQEFLDETDSSLYFVLFGSDDLAIPIAILDVGMSNWTPETKPRKEYLICFTTLGIFVDEDGRRTRGEDITWNRFPQSINYRHPNLYIFHHSSVEVIRLNAESYTKTRVGLDLESTNVGKEVATIPTSNYLDVPSPNFIGKGQQPGSIVITSKDKSRLDVFDINLDATPSNHKGTKETRKSDKTHKPSSSTSPLSTTSSSDDDSESQLESEVY